MRWYQRSDPNIGRPGYLVSHRLVRYHLQIVDLEDMQNDSKSQEAFTGFREVLDSLSETLKPMKETMVRSFLTPMIQQVNKHNQRYLLTPKLVRAVFAEKETGQLVAAMLNSWGGGHQMSQQENTSQSYMVVKSTYLGLQTGL
jgi:hypothetical protein